jgi:hypothetical protein
MSVHDLLGKLPTAPANAGGHMPGKRALAVEMGAHLHGHEEIGLRHGAGVHHAEGAH